MKKLKIQEKSEGFFLDFRLKWSFLALFMTFCQNGQKKEAGKPKKISFLSKIVKNTYVF